MAQPSVQVEGLRELHRALKKYDDEVRREFEAELRLAGEIVSSEAAQRFSVIDTRSAAGFRPRVRGFGRVVVEQRRRRTTGARPDFGSLQMTRALLPALAANQERIGAHVEDMLDWVGRRNGF